MEGINKKHKGQIRWFMSYYKPHIRLFILDMLCASFVAGIDLIFPITTRTLLNEYVPNGMYTEFLYAIAFLVAAYLVRSLMLYIITYYGHTMGVLIEADMRSDLFKHVQGMSFSFFDKTRTGQILSRIMNDLFDVTELAHHGPEDLFISIITLIGSFIYLVQVQWILAIAVFAFVPVLVIFIVRQRRRLHKTAVKVREKMAGINTELESSISGTRVAQAFANESYETQKFEQGNQRFKTAKSRQYKAMSFLHTGMEFLTAMMPLVVIVVGGYLIMQNSMKIQDLITFNLFIASFIAPIRKLTNFVDQFTTGMAGFSRFAELMSSHSEITDTPDAIDLEDVKGYVQLKNVSFSYGSKTDVLHNVNLNIESGMTLALVGPSGGGKTTLCHLIPRFYDVTEGQVFVDGIPVTQLKLESLRRNIGIVQQDVFLFAGDIWENIRYGRIDATDEEIIEAAKKAEIHQDIMQMPDGYHTTVGERGVTLSGGQKQRISIARIFLKNPPILILDEATSALDTQTELKIQHSFERLSEGRTTIVIAHRLSTIRNADEIAYVGDSSISEQGSHEQLMNLRGDYYRLYNAQFGE